MEFDKNRPYILVDSQLRPINNSADDLAFRGEYAGSNLVYKGFGRPGAREDENVWQISFLEYDGSGNVLSIKWPQDSDGAPSNDYKFSWTNRASYTYG